MKKTSANLLLAGMATSILVLASSANPAISQCIQKHPLFGVDVYVDDKYCQKKMIKKNAVKKQSSNGVVIKKSSRRVAVAPDDRVKKMQNMLTSMGYDAGPADGLKGPATRKAAGDFNVANDLPRNASTGSTMAILRSLKGPKASPSMAVKSDPAPAPQKMVKAPTPEAPKGTKRVREMQTLLASMGYNPGTTDGIRGPSTQKAAGDFNVANDLPRNASTGSTLAVLKSLMGPKTPFPVTMNDTTPQETVVASVTAPAPAGDSGVREMQTLLASLGYNPGPANGVESPETSKALGQFHQSMGLPGSTSRSNTMVLLNRAAGK